MLSQARRRLPSFSSTKPSCRDSTDAWPSKRAVGKWTARSFDQCVRSPVRYGGPGPPRAHQRHFGMQGRGASPPVNVPRTLGRQRRSSMCVALTHTEIGRGGATPGRAPFLTVNNCHTLNETDPPAPLPSGARQGRTLVVVRGHRVGDDCSSATACPRPRSQRDEVSRLMPPDFSGYGSRSALSP